MGVRPSILLLKDLATTKNLISIFQCNEKHFFDINSMIDCSFVQDHQWHYTLGTGAPPSHYFLWKFSSLLNVTLVSIRTIDYPHSIILRVIDTANGRKLLTWKENPHDFFFSKICSSPIYKLFPFDLLIIGNQ